MAIRYLEASNTYQVYWNNPITHKRESKNFPTKKQAKKENSQILYRLKYNPESFKHVEKYTLSEVLSLYLKEKQLSRKSEECLYAALKPSFSLLEGKDIVSITKEDLEAVKASYVANTDISSATVHTRLARLKTLLNYAVERNLIPSITFPKIPSPRYQQFVPPSTEEIKKLLDVAPNHIQRVIVIGAYLGVRIGSCELFKLTWDDVDFTKNVLKVHGSNKNPNALVRDVPIKESLIPVFIKWKEQDEGIPYLINYKGKPVKSIKHAWSTTLKQAGITRRIRPYDLRHAFGTELIANGADVGTVAKLMGHSNASILLNHYQYILDKQKRQAIENLPTITL